MYLSVEKRGKAECLDFIFLHVTISFTNQVNDAPRIRTMSFTAAHHNPEISVSGIT